MILRFSEIGQQTLSSFQDPIVNSRLSMAVSIQKDIPMIYFINADQSSLQILLFNVDDRELCFIPVTYLCQESRMYWEPLLAYLCLQKQSDPKLL